MDMMFRMLIGSLGVVVVTWISAIIVYETVGFNLWATVIAFGMLVFGVGLITRWF